MLYTSLLVIIGLAILVGGGEALVRGAIALARRLGVPTLVIGLTIVSFGTSAPEMVISVQAVLSGYPDIALGNIIGSNLANTLVVLGVAALITPIAVHSKLVARDAPVLLAATVLLVVFCLGGLISRPEAGIFLVIVLYYTWHILRSAKSGGEQELIEEIKEETAVDMPLWLSLLYVVAGCGLLVFGSDMLVHSSATLARMLGVPEAVIGLTILAVGSSAPEMVTSIVAARRGHSDIALGNVVGSNLFNICAIGGVAVMIHPIAVAKQFLTGDLWILLFITAALVLFMLTGRRITRREGLVLCSLYVAYAVWLYYITEYAA